MKVYRNITTAILFLALSLCSFSAFAETPDVEGVVNINKASQGELAYLPRVGPALAERIATFREENGEFEQPEDLMLVRGIGEKTFELMKPYVVISGETTLEGKVRVRRPSSDEEADDSKE